MYDEELRRLGLKSTQLTVLQALGASGATTQARLAERLGMDSTTLSRNVKVLEGNGWIRGTEGTDRRERHLALTEVGRDLLRKADKPWNRVQERLQEALGPGPWEALFTLSEAVTQATSRT